MDALEAELALVARHLLAGVRMGRLQWGDGTPTILPPVLIHIAPADTLDFSVEIDPTLVDRAKIDAGGGLTRASLGIQDLGPLVQDAIGCIQSFEATARTVADLRAAGVGSLNTDPGPDARAGRRRASCCASTQALRATR